MRDFTKEDAVFLKTIPKLKNFMRHALASVRKSNRNYQELTQDLIQDSFIIFRNILTKTPLVLGVDIEEEKLQSYIVRIAYSRFYSLIKGASPHYFEDVPHKEMLSIQQIEEFLDRGVKSHKDGVEMFLETHSLNSSIELELNYDMKNMINHLSKKITKRQLPILNALIIGNQQVEIKKITGETNHNFVHNTVKKIRQQSIKYLNSENTFFNIKDGRTIRSLKNI